MMPQDPSLIVNRITRVSDKMAFALSEESKVRNDR